MLVQVPVQRCPQHEAYPILKEALIRVLPVRFTSLARLSSMRKTTAS